jgi:hypothetical protein
MNPEFEHLIDRPLRSSQDRERRCLELVRAYAACTITELELLELIRLQNELEDLAAGDS